MTNALLVALSLAITLSVGFQNCGKKEDNNQVQSEQPTPTPADQPTPTPATSATPTPTPSGDTSPTPTPSATPTATPTPTSDLTLNCYIDGVFGGGATVIPYPTVTQTNASSSDTTNFETNTCPTAVSVVKNEIEHDLCWLGAGKAYKIRSKFEIVYSGGSPKVTMWTHYNDYTCP